MAEHVVLPDEAIDMTLSELHVLVADRLMAVLTILFGERALVHRDIFVRVNETAQVSPDILIVPGAVHGARTVYRIPPEPVPAVTIEILSPANYTGDGRRQLEDKRQLLGAIGVPFHLEIDPTRGSLTTWHNIDGRLVSDPPTDHYHGDTLAGLTIELTPGRVLLREPDGSEFTDAPTEITQLRGHNQQLQGHNQRLAEALRRAGIDPDSV